MQRAAALSLVLIVVVGGPVPASAATVFVIGREGTLVGKALSNKDWLGPTGRAVLQALVAR